jgi:hypothetical protein
MARAFLKIEIKKIWNFQIFQPMRPHLLSAKSGGMRTAGSNITSASLARLSGLQVQTMRVSI